MTGMSSRSKRLILVCLVAVVIASTLIVKELISSQLAENDEYKLYVEMVLKDAINEVKEIRGLSPGQVDIEIVTLSWVKENWGRSYADADKEGLLREERIYKSLFMMPENASLYEAKVEWAGVAVAAVWQGKVYIVKDHFNISDSFNAERTLVHELTHILQDKYFQISDRPTQDGGKARSALIEGDACLMEEAYANKTKSSGLFVEITSKQSPKAIREDLRYGGYRANIPDSISRLNYFPYEHGLKFARELFGMGSWEAINQAYRNAPLTTEQIIHPQKYIDGETEEKVDEPMVEKGWQKIKNERFGEYFILVMLGNWITLGEAQKAAEGWGGDNFTYYEQGSDYLFTWNTSWDSAKEASEFYASFQEMMTRNDAERKSEDFWQAHGRYLSIRREETKILIVSSTNWAAVKKVLEGT